MKKIIGIGDIHGRNLWKNIITEECDKIIFFGDYHDIYHELKIDAKHKRDLITKKESISNFLEIIDFKKENPDKVVLLIGNHDSHYIYDYLCKSTRYDFDNCKKINKIFRENLDLFQYVYKIDNHIFTHAGISQNWYNTNKELFGGLGLSEDLNNIEDVFILNDNNILQKSLNCIGYLRGGYSEFGGITWADYNETVNDLYRNLNQYVGHTKVEKFYKRVDEEKNASITFCDTLHNYDKDDIYNNFIMLNL